MELMTLLISALSLLVAVVAILYAVHASGSAKKDVQHAIEQANTANQLSTDANVIAEDSKTIAIESRKIGEEALTIARRTDLRESDTSNIHWEGDWKKPGIYAITNRGDDEARNVRIILTVDEEEVRVTEESVPGGGTIEIECPRAKAVYIREILEYRGKIRAYDAARSSRYGFAPQPTPMDYSWHRIGERIDWVTQGGKPGFHDMKYPVSTLGNFG